MACHEHNALSNCIKFQTTGFLEAIPVTYLHTPCDGIMQQQICSKQQWTDMLWSNGLSSFSSHRSCKNNFVMSRTGNRTKNENFLQHTCIWVPESKCKTTSLNWLAPWNFCLKRAYVRQCTRGNCICQKMLNLSISVMTLQDAWN